MSRQKEKKDKHIKIGKKSVKVPVVSSKNGIFPFWIL
jgi:hypothetical protein